MAKGVVVHQLKVTLADTQPPIWRRLHVPASMPLGDLHGVIQRAFGWTDSHLHEFHVGGRRYGVRDEEEFDPEVLDEERFTVGMVAPDQSRFQYEYDFGDEWTHEIRVENVFASDHDHRYPACVAGERACPPEDCGGPRGYAALIDPANPRHSDLMEWYGGPFAADRFDVRSVNRLIQPPPKARARSTPRRPPRSPSSKSAPPL
jgi:hypothetical protein